MEEGSLGVAYGGRLNWVTSSFGFECLGCSYRRQSRHSFVLRITTVEEKCTLSRHF